jgi:hypothetical protein
MSVAMWCGWTSAMPAAYAPALASFQALPWSSRSRRDSTKPSWPAGALPSMSTMASSDGTRSRIPRIFSTWATSSANSTRVWESERM